jgi:multicomponent Na+:H+ antiporter subunit G
VTPREIAVLALAASGAFFGVVGAVGLVRLPDLYARAHSTSKSETLGAVLSLGAVAVAFGGELSTLKALVLLVFLFLTNPTAAHAIARAAADQGIEPWTVDDGGDGSEPGDADPAGANGGSSAGPAPDGGSSAGPAPDGGSSERDGGEQP